MKIETVYILRVGSDIMLIADIHNWLDEYKKSLYYYFPKDYIEEAIEISKDIVAKRMAGEEFTLDLIVNGVYCEAYRNMLSMVPNGYHWSQVDHNEKIPLANIVSDDLLRHLKQLLRVHSGEINRIKF